MVKVVKKVKETLNEDGEKVIHETITTDYNKKSKLVFILLAWFTGGIGGQYLYLGKGGKFILSLIFCWTGIPAIIALVHFLSAICESEEKFQSRFK